MGAKIESLTFLELVFVDFASFWSILLRTEPIEQLLYVHQRAHHLRRLLRRCHWSCSTFNCGLSLRRVDHRLLMISYLLNHDSIYIKPLRYGLF